MDPKKVAAEWFRNTVFRDETIRPSPARSTERVPAILRAARALANNGFHSWQSAETLFLKQGKLLANYEDDYDGDCGEVLRYYTTYQSLTDRQLRAYFSWRTKLRRGDVREAPLSFAFLYIYELLNQIGVADPMEGYRKLVEFRDAYGGLDRRILSYLSVWLADYVVYYGLDSALLSEAPQAVRDRSIAVLERIREEPPERIMDAVRQLSKWLERSRFYADHREDMDTVTVQVLRRISAHYAARCKKTMTEQYFGALGSVSADLFNAAVFCDPLKRKNYEYTASEQCVYTCKNGYWTVWRRVSTPGSRGKLDDLLKAIDSDMRTAYEYGHPVKAKVETKWILRTIREEVQTLLAEQKANQEKKITIDYGQLSKIRLDAAVTQEKLIVEEDMDPVEEPLPGAGIPQSAPAALESLDGGIPQSAPAALTAPFNKGALRAGTTGSALPPLLKGGGPRVSAVEGFRKPLGTLAPSDGDVSLKPEEYRLLHDLLYGGDMVWVQGEGHLLSVLVDGINETLYDTFQDSVLDDTPCLFEDYIDDLKEMIHP